jgi:hypothetical protein
MLTKRLRVEAAHHLSMLRGWAAGSSRATIS